MIYNWFKIFNLDEFESLGLTSRTYDLELENVGTKKVLVTKGILVGVTYEDVFLPINLNDKNPFEFEGLAVYLAPNNNVHLGIAVDES